MGRDLGAGPQNLRLWKSNYPSLGWGVVSQREVDVKEFSRVFCLFQGKLTNSSPTYDVFIMGDARIQIQFCRISKPKLFIFLFFFIVAILRV